MRIVYLKKVSDDIKDKADAVLTSFLIAIPMIAMVFMLGMNLGDAAENKNILRASAQESVSLGTSKIAFNGYVDPQQAIPAAVKRYESLTTKSPRAKQICGKQEITTSTGKKTVNLPYYEFTFITGGEAGFNKSGLAKNRGAAGSKLFAFESGSSTMTTLANSSMPKNATGMRMVVHDYAMNFSSLPPMVGACQVHVSEVGSSISFDAKSASSPNSTTP